MLLVDAYNKERSKYLKTLHLEKQTAPEPFPVNYTVRTIEGQIDAWIWGDDSLNLNLECNHFEVQFGDDDDCGVCLLCGATCTWHWAKDFDGEKEVEERRIDEWDESDTISPLIIYQEIVGRQK